MTTVGTSVQVVCEGRIVTVTLDGPDEENRLTPDALGTLEALVAGLAEDEEAQVVVLIGVGTQFFSSGILNPALRAGYSKNEIVTLVRLANRVYDGLEALPQITIAALNGITRSGAAELALACDIRLAARHAVFAMPEARWGGFPGRAVPCACPPSSAARGRSRSSAPVAR